MANIGDLVTTIVADASGYKMTPAIGENRALGGSLDAIIGKLEKQKKAFGQQPTTLDNIRKHAAEGADAGKVLKANALMEDVDALRAKKAAEDAATAAAQRAKVAGDNLNTTLERQAKTYGMSAAEIKRYEAAQAGASKESLRAASQTQHQIDVQQRFERDIQRQIATQRQAQAATAGMSRNSMILTESMRGLEDAVSGFSNNGLKGMLMATTNNVGQIGSLIGGTAGLYLGIGSIAALAATSLLPMLAKWANSTEEVTKREKELADEQRRHHQETMSQIAERSRESFRKQDVDTEHRKLVNDPDAKSQALQQEMDAAKKRAQESNRQQRVEMMQADELRKQRFRNEQDVRSAQLAGEGKSEAVGAIETQNREIEKKLSESSDRIRILKHEEVAAKQQAEEAFNAKQRQAAKELSDAKIAEDRREQDELLSLRKERADKEKKFRDDLAKSTMDLIRTQNPRLADEIDQKKTRSEQSAKFNDAFNRGIINKDELSMVNNAINKPQQYGLGGSAAAIQTGSTAAYSEIVKAMNKTKQDNFAKSQADDTKKLVTVLEKVEANTKEVFQVVVIN